MSRRYEVFEECVRDIVAPDPERLVVGGFARGVARERRGRVLAACASVAVMGVVAAGAVAVPRLMGAPADVVVAGDTASPAPTPPSSSTPPEPGALAVTATDIPAVVTGLFPGEVSAAAERTGGVMDGGPDSQVAHFLWNGTLLSVGAVRDETMAEQMCARGTVCTQRPDGSTLLTWGETGPALDGGVAARGVSLFRADGWEVFAISYNAADGKDAPVLAPEPPFTHAQLEQVVSSADWYE
jgi:hypothetical protein